MSEQLITKKLIKRNKKGRFKRGNQIRLGKKLTKKTINKLKKLAKEGKIGFKKGNQMNKGRIQLPEIIARRNKTMKKVMKTRAYKLAHHKGMLGLQNALGTKQSKETIAKRMKTMKPIFNSKKYKSKQRENRLHQVFPTKDSKPERMVQQMLKANNISYQTHYPIIGQPDLFVKPSVCIFVDGCYWHGCKRCHPKIWEKYRQVYEQIVYDNEITHTLTVRGYYVIRIWEHEITPNNIEVAKNVIKIIGMARS